MNSSTPVSQVPVEAQRNRATRRFALSRRRQRKGQALILAVLIMLMVAVLSAGFLVVVSGNLNQTARITDKTRAVESARSGLKFVNDQLTYSQLGENWRPGFLSGPIVDDNKLLSQGESRIPPANDPARSLYYSSVDQANGWAGTFAKFPDPLAPRSDAPQYLARVQVVSTAPYDPNNLSTLDVADPDRAALNAGDASKLGMLRITVIGLSNDDPAAFSKVVAYKQPSPFGRYAHTINLWDFKNNTVPVGNIDPNTAATTTKLTLVNVSGQFPPAPFLVVIGNAKTGVTLQSATVSDVTNNVLTLARPLTGPVPGADTRVGMAAPIGFPKPILPNGSTDANKDASAIDYNLNGTIDSGDAATLTISSNTQPGSIWINGDGILAGNLASNALTARTVTTGAPTPGNVQVAGLLAFDSTVTNLTPTIQGQTALQPSDTPEAVSGSLVSSTDVNFPGTWMGPLTGTSAQKSQKADYIVSDGFARLASTGGAVRQTAPIQPPNISSGPEATRYRQLANAGDPQTGKQSGIYINNPSDRERVYDATTDPANPKLRDMTQGELIQMWLSRKADGVTDDRTYFYNRLGKVPVNVGDPTVAALTAVDASLEEQHLRGWVGPDEFHARGALIELFNDGAGTPKIAITLDSRSDNTPVVGATPAVTTNASGPVTAKAWKDATTGATQPGVYRKVFDWPKNGVIFAEANARVRGTAINVPNSLTIISQNNLYIDGSVGVSQATGTPAKKVLLIARRNVIANPTQAIFRPDVQTVVPAAPTGTTVSLTVGGAAQDVTVTDATDFKAGDVVEAASTTAPATVKAVGFVTTTPTSATTVNLTALSTGTIDPNDVVRTRADDKQTTAAGITRPVIASATDAIQRRFQISTIANLRLAFYHNADAIKALSVGIEAVPTYTTPSSSVTLSHKKKGAATAPDYKVLIGTYSDPVPAGTDQFPTSTSTEPTLTDNSVDAIISALKAKDHPSTPSIPGSVNWRYTAVVDPDFTSYTAATPFHYLSALGNRLPYGPPPSAGTPVTIWDGTTSTPADILMATSITPFLNGSGVSLLGFDGDGASQFGFSPTAYVPAAQAAEDGLTVDKSFYQGTTAAGIPDPTTNNATLDSRALTGAAVGINPFVLRQNTGIVSNVLLPIYRSGNMKLESVNPAAFGSPGSGDINPGYMMNINAFVYAQMGSWFVIPTAPSDPLLQQVKGNAVSSYIDFNNNNTKDPGEYVTGTGANAGLEGADLNRNGVLDVGEAQAHLRYSRPDYQIKFTGAIAENQSAIVNPVGAIPGAVQAWSNSWASYNVSGGTLSNPDGTSPTPNAGVVYTFDPDYANNNLDPTDPGFVMPQSDQLTYVE